MTDNNNTATLNNPSNGSYDSEIWDKPKYAFPKATSESSTHSGNCHCGAIRFRFTISPPLHEYPVICCNCSICARNGALLVYPNREDFVLERPTAEKQGVEGGWDKDGEVLGGYSFGDAKVSHRFCKKCGCSPFSTLVPGHWERFMEAMCEEVRELVPVNVSFVLFSSSSLAESFGKVRRWMIGWLGSLIVGLVLANGDLNRSA